MKKIYVILSILLIIALGGTLGHYLYKNARKGTLRASTSEIQAVVTPVVDCTFNEQDMINMMNGVRTNKLVLDTYLDGVSQKRADTMPYELDNHVGMKQLIADGVTFNVKYDYVGEILASNHCPTTKQIFFQWQTSPDHWKAITNEQYDVLGIGFNGQSVVVIFGDLR